MDNTLKYWNTKGELKFDNIKFVTIPAYNNGKVFHPKLKKWLGYVITTDNITYYIAGDTDATVESNNVKCDIAPVPLPVIS